MRCLSNKEVRVAFQFLKETLPKRPTAVCGLYSLPKELDQAFNGSDHQKEVTLQKISDHMGYFLGLLTSVKVTFAEKKKGGERTHAVFVTDNDGNVGKETTSEFIEEERYAGLYRVIGYDHKEILIVNDRTFYLTHFLSVLAHEVTHNYLYHHQVTAPKNIDPEELTDLATIFLGFGSIILHGYKPSSALSCTLGYIDVETIERAILQAYSLRDWNISDVVRKFAWFESHRYYFLVHLLPRAVWKALSGSASQTVQAKDDKEKRIIICASCGQKLRLPNMPTDLKVNCPKCDSSFIVGRSHD